jgi:hypothetical protein
MCKELPVIPVYRVVNNRRIFKKKWRVEEEERHLGSLTIQKMKILLRAFNAHKKLHKHCNASQ